MSLFAKTGNYSILDGGGGGADTTPHIVVGSVHKAHPSNNRERIWEYLGFGAPPTDPKNVTPGISPKHQKGIVVGGDLESRSFCTLSGFQTLDRPMRPATFPADCSKNRTGNFRGDYLCGNMAIHERDSVILPCSGESNNLQLSDHSIISISLLPRDDSS